MLTKIDNTIKYGKQHGGFGIQILFPGKIRPQLHDSGFATLGRIDHARIMPGTLIPMHPHRDDEILTYLRSGKVKHVDSFGYTDVVSAQHLMVMNAGSKFQHEELSMEDGGLLEGLQIFIRPETAGLKPQVQFHQLPEVYSINRWRKIAVKEMIILCRLGATRGSWTCGWKKVRLLLYRKHLEKISRSYFMCLQETYN